MPVIEKQKKKLKKKKKSLAFGHNEELWLEGIGAYEA